MSITLADFDEVVHLDFEFQAKNGGKPKPVCCVAIEQNSGKVYRCWLDGESPPIEPPFPHGPGVLTVAYFALAELGGYRALGWPSPKRGIDLYAEFRAATNGPSTGSSL